MIVLEDILKPNSLSDFYLKCSKINLPISKLNLKKIEKITKNNSYILYIENLPRFVLKCTPNAKKEMKVYSFSNYNHLFDTLRPVFYGEGFLLTEYEPTIQEYDSAFSYIENLAMIHGSQISRKLDYTEILGDNSFGTDIPQRAITRVNKHRELVHNFFLDVDMLLRFFEINPLNTPPELRILLHGDINEGNIVKTDKNQFVYLDFELSLLERPTWDLARIILRVKTDEVDQLLEIYANKLKDCCGSSLLYTSQDLRHMAIVDFVYKFTSVGIAVQQHEYFKTQAQGYLEKINNHLRKMI